MDEYHETLGRVASCILSSDDTIRQSRVFQVDGRLYKGYQIVRDNNIINVVSTKESGYINVELTTTLAARLQGIIDEADLERIVKQQQNSINQNIDKSEALDLHLRQELPDLDDESTRAAMEEIEEVVDDTDVRLDWVTYNDSGLLNGFTLYTRLFPESLSIESYDQSVNRISHYGPKVEDGFTNAFGSFLEDIEADDEEVPTGGGDSEEVGQGVGGRGFA
ncbi:hypothetical protein GLW36_12625 [Halorubrum terrestre]|uniref:DUF2226 domain-containing protein n=1 Tax=Halorubrum distributum TaxID=29283 RepID=A0A6B1IQX3_9EURY|nr:hypothetical protein [Halorubrum terrestre]MYL17484.1 hypothetical protein [Halorubrum terrestre]